MRLTDENLSNSNAGTIRDAVGVFIVGFTDFMVDFLVTVNMRR